jgi:trans-AT polyketide synthase, acyltransferase and oxidoreductase domains
MGAMIAWAFAGQGSQRKGMGAPIWQRFPDHCGVADDLLGYSIRELCLDNPERRLSQTEFAQPAIYVVGALSALAMLEDTRSGGAAEPAFLVGHSVGEFAALFVAGCFDFATGLRLVQQRGALMARAHGGGMLAVLQLEAGRVRELLAQHQLAALDVANYNLPRQIVLSGPRTLLPAAQRVLDAAGARCVMLDVSAAFHSRYMEEAAQAFAEVVRGIAFAAPRWPVLSNVTAEPYHREELGRLLVQQIRSPVRWLDCMDELRRRGVTELREVGRTRVLTEMWRTALAEPRSEGDDVVRDHSTSQCSVAASAAAPVLAASRAESAALSASPAAPVAASTAAAASTARAAGPTAESLGSAAFRRDYRLRYAYLAGSMFRGIASVALVIRLAEAGLMGFFGTGGLSLAQIDAALTEIRAALGLDGRFGVNLLSSVGDDDGERALVDLYLRHDVRNVEASAYTQVTPSLVAFRFHGATVAPDGTATTPRRVIAKVSRPEVAAAFLRPAPEAMVQQLRDQGRLTSCEAEVARRLPLCQDLCVESDSGGHTDGGVALTLLPVMTRLRDEAMLQHQYPERIRVGASGGLGTPEAVAAAFVLGADFVVTGSVNQCSPEAGTSAAVKDLLATLDVQDTSYAPAGDMFELGAKVQVVRKGTLFAARANQLYQLYRQVDSLEAIDARTRSTIETTWFRRPFEAVWRQTSDYFQSLGRPEELALAERNPKHRMALVFRWYFAHSIQLALAGDASERVNFQIHCGPAMGAFNRFVRGTELEPWQARHVDRIADRLMRGAAEVLRRSPVLS